jgi:hypothetical protein
MRESMNIELTARVVSAVQETTLKKICYLFGTPDEPCHWSDG